MSAPRISFAALGRLFNLAEQPIYVLDGELTIVFLNQACRDWIGDPADGLFGQRCAYHSRTDAGGDGFAAALCPPPAVLSGETAVGTVAPPGVDGATTERRTLFTPVPSGDGSLLAIVAVVDFDDMDASAADPRWLAHRAGIEVAADPVDTAVLHDRIRRFRQEAALRYGADRLIGEGPAMRLARQQVALAASSRCGVLLVGPPGSGRQHLAAAIHYASAQSSNAAAVYLPLDCALLAGDLLEAVGEIVARPAVRDQPGTLLLHRIDELPAEVQVQLHDLLTRRPSAWRLVATASEPLGELARRGKFRDDLASLLSTVTIQLPSLADRREDLPLLAQLFVEDANAAGAKQLAGVSAAALERLDAYAWPGNLDELAQVVAEAHGRAAGPKIEAADLPDRLLLAAQAAAHPRRVDETIVLDEYLGHVERELIRRALARSKGNKARAARLLGVTRPRLYRRMVQLGLE
ncbi:MAG: sigma 54-interacting transcriptional regulator [Thermoguttaceae bacterium]